VEYLAAAVHRLEFRWIEPRRAGAPTLVFLHEALGSAELWRDFPDHLADRSGAGTLVYSRAGHGRSGPPPDFRGPDHFAHEALVVLPQVLAARGIARPVLVGHSDGATIALASAASHALAAVALILEAPHVFVEDITVAGVAAARAAFTEGRLRERLARWHDHVDPMFFRWADTWLDPAFRGWTMEPALPNVRCPTLVIQGDPDPYGSVAQVEAIRRGANGRVETLVLPGGGHAPHAERPAEVLDTMVRFVGRLSEPEAA
jgi:pimeloyl-ACP methyl ester carboxylesterase